MTRKEAIDILQGAIKKPNTKDGYLGQAIDMAINALEQEPCEDAISRQEVLSYLCAHCPDNAECFDDCDDIKNIKALPSVRPQEPFNIDTYCKEHFCVMVDKDVWEKAEKALEQKTGHWIGIDEEPHEDYECDNCGYVVSTFTANIEPHTEYKYCPNCGAKMESEEKHDTDR